MLVTCDDLYSPSSSTRHSLTVSQVSEQLQEGFDPFSLSFSPPLLAGGPADRAGLKKQEFVIAVNGQDTTSLSHHKVVSIIFNTKTPGVWLTVCDGPQSSGRGQTPQNALPSGNRLGFNRVHSLGSFSISQSTPVFPRNMTDSPRYSSVEDSPPKYQDLQKYGHQGGNSGNHVLRHKDQGAPVSNRISPLTKNLLQQSAQHNGYSASSSGIHKPGLQNAKHLATFGMSEQSLFANSKTSPTPVITAFTSASVLVLYIGPVEIPESWSSRELSSKCLQECTRRLLSQRQEFVEAFLEVTLSSMKILSVSQAVIFKHKREELYYSGVCSNDEQTFGIVTKKPDQKSGKKSISGSNISKPIRAHMCHVFKVMQHKSVLMLHSGGDSKDSTKGKNKALTPQHKPQKTIPIKSCVTIINAIQGIFTGTAVPGKSFDEAFGVGGLILKPTLNTYSSGSSNESMYANGNPDKPKKKKLDVVDLRPSAYLPPPAGSLLAATPPSSTQNMYVSLQHPTTTATVTPTANASPLVNHHVRSQSNPATDYMGTPAYHQRSAIGGSGSGFGGGGALGGSGGGGIGGGTSWYASDSPKEEYHPRTRSWGNKSPVPLGYGGGGGRSHDQHHEGSSGNRRILTNKNSSNPQHDRMKRFSDDSSLSSFSDSRASSPTKTSHRSSYDSHSRSPSPDQSPSYSSRSRTPSPVQTDNKWTTTGGLVFRPPRMGASAARRQRSGMALEVGSVRSGAISPNSMARSFRGSRANLRRQVS